VKTARFERVCNGEEPICPWSLLRNSTHQPAAAEAAAADNDTNADQPQPQRQDLPTSCCPLQG